KCTWSSTRSTERAIGARTTFAAISCSARLDRQAAELRGLTRSGQCDPYAHDRRRRAAALAALPGAATRAAATSSAAQAIDELADAGGPRHHHATPSAAS